MEPIDSRCIQYPSSSDDDESDAPLTQGDIAFIDDAAENDDRAFYLAADQAVDPLVAFEAACADDSSGDAASEVSAGSPPDPGAEDENGALSTRLVCASASNRELLKRADPEGELTPDQQRVIIILFKRHRSVLVGPGGTGKSKTVAAFCRAHAKKTSVLVLTPTNSQMMGFVDVATACTTHGFTGSGSRGIRDKSYLLDSLRRKWGKRTDWNDVRTLIIDEVGLVSGCVWKTSCWLNPCTVRRSTLWRRGC